MDEMTEIEKEIQGEVERRTVIEKQFFKAMGRCDFEKANELSITTATPCATWWP